MNPTIETTLRSRPTALNPNMRLVLLLSTILPFSVLACTTFKVTQDGHTLVGCNEDAWSINAQVRFEQGRDGQYGGIYFGHYNGSPIRIMMDQIGMNEMGLMFDGLGIQPKTVPPVAGKQQAAFHTLIPLMLRGCADVPEALAMLANYDRSAFDHAMILLVDRAGRYAVVQNDTIIEGHDPWYALGNWRMGTCSDPGAIPIPRLQAGRALLTEGIDASLDGGTRVLDSMKSCRTKLGNGTLFSALFDPVRGQAHLYFYHDFTEVRTFDLKAELAKGDRTIDMASLFGKRPEYDALVAYITPFHQRWLFWGLLGIATVAAMAGFYGALALLRNIIARMRRRAAGPALPLISLGLVSLLIICLAGVLLLNEGVYYFGLGDVDPVLAWLPLAIMLFSVPVVRIALPRGNEAARSGPVVFFSRTISLSVLVLIGLTLYWDLLSPW